MQTGVVVFVLLGLVALSYQQATTTGLLAYPTYNFPNVSQQITLVAAQFGIRTTFQPSVVNALSYSLTKIGFYGNVSAATGANYVGVYSDVAANSVLLASGTFTSTLNSLSTLTANTGRYEVPITPAIPLPSSGQISYYLSFFATNLVLLSPGNGSTPVLFASSSGSSTPGMPASVNWINTVIPDNAKLLQPGVYFVSNVTLPLTPSLSIPLYPLLPSPFLAAVNPKPSPPKNEPN